MPAFTLRVTGNATMTKTAEQANLRVASSSDGSNKQAVSDQVCTTAKYIEDMIHNAQAQYASASPVTHWSQTSLSTDTWIEQIPRHLAQGQDIVGHASKSPLTGGAIFGYNNPLGLDSSSSDVVSVNRYRARIVFDISFQDFSILSQFNSHLSSLDHCVVSSPSWVLTPSTEERVKSQLRTKAAKDARSKVVDYCQVVCPGQDDVIIVPTELGSENIAGGLFSAANGLKPSQGMPFGTGKSQLSLFGNTRLGGGKPDRLPSSTPGNDADINFTPQELSMATSIDLVFTVETRGFKLSTILHETD